ncbi:MULTISPECIES: efflux RND transporter periplasmic adaptor subunit [Flavobacteriaceae]|jgi:cobalt-zinc-cadmium efflux system membrane fusion protein|uniref:Cobalt-zinc-cadmium efflux system membrane fusion protein n=1 Tax=Mesonia maritima TaxID=1793873 RepID=A0ABU1K304_9FLAO|nr:MULTISPECIES: efflux RND transporter periplasmic adaptor subunit [Flavobacteriaceae]MCC4227437.1 efflux RND transporter periplasmic adaptor subunit [Zunongwangia profunda]MDR6299992.1 cobalt-zinc-cadmium efflux system membrane fusion protein [Mesonia maritima]
MNTRSINILTLALTLSLFFGCKENSETGEDLSRDTATTNTEEGEGHNEEGEEEGGMGAVHLSDLKFNSLGIKVDTLPKKALSGLVEANGQLEVPPQYEATVTAILGGNVTSIKVIEGDKVNKGQVLAYLAHPDLTRIQTDYINAFNRMQFLEDEFNRQKRLYEAEVGSGKTFQQTRSDYQSVKGEVTGYESQIRQLNLSPSQVRNGDLYEYVPVVSPIAGYIEKVKVQVGQYVEPQTGMFMVVDNEHVHADLMVFEKDIYKVKEGQKISFSLESVPGSNLTGEIYSVGKQFEQNPKAVHVHAEIDKKEDYLIPGMYIQGKIRTGASPVTALPEEAIIEEDGNPYIFTAQKHQEDGETEWELKPVQVRTGITEDGWVEIKLLEPLPEGTMVAYNNAYYLVSEMQKSQTSHGH